MGMKTGERVRVPRASRALFPSRVEIPRALSSLSFSRKLKPLEEGTRKRARETGAGDRGEGEEKRIKGGRER